MSNVKAGLVELLLEFGHNRSNNEGARANYINDLEMLTEKLTEERNYWDARV